MRRMFEVESGGQGDCLVESVEQGDCSWINGRSHNEWALV